jgi:predicted glycosyltransferase
MKILFEANHPAHVHFFKNTIWNLEDRGHEVLIEARDKEITLALLEAYKLKYKIVGPHYKCLIKKAYGLVKTDYKLLKIAKTFKPDILVGRGSPYLAHLSMLINRPYIAFVDTEHANLVANLTLPFADVICTPSCFKRGLNPKKHVQFDGYKELAYLHPNYFKPDSSVLDDLGLSKNDKFIVLRFVSWAASHDIGQYGLDLEAKKRLIKELEKDSRIFITSELELGKDFENYKIRVQPKKIHDLLYYATMYIGEGSTMATETGILGTPSIYVSTLSNLMGNFEELEKRYGLVYPFRDTDMALEKAINLLEDKDIKKKWRKKREKLLNEKIDVTKFMTWFVEEYPKSFYRCKEEVIKGEKYETKR